MWLLFTNRPGTRTRARSWEWETVRANAYRSNKTVDDRLWWIFRTKAAADRMQEYLRANNKGVGMRTTLKQVTKVPSGWE